MTFDTLRRWLPLALALTLIAAVLVLGFSLERALTAGRDARAEVARLTEAQQLADRGFAVARRDAATLGRQADRLLNQHRGLAAEVERLRRASPGARVVGAIELDTGTVTAGGIPSSGVPPPAVASSAPVDGTPAVPDHPPPPAAAGCLLWPGEGSAITVALLPYETEAGNLVFPWQAVAWRQDPAGRVQLFTGGGRSAPPASITWRPAEARPGWAFGPAVELGSRSGWLYGAQASPPPWGPVELHLRVAGNGQEGQLGAAVLWRFR